MPRPLNELLATRGGECFPRIYAVTPYYLSYQALQSEQLRETATASGVLQAFDNISPDFEHALLTSERSRRVNCYTLSYPVMSKLAELLHLNAEQLGWTRDELSWRLLTTGYHRVVGFIIQAWDRYTQGQAYDDLLQQAIEAGAGSGPKPVSSNE